MNFNSYNNIFRANYWSGLPFEVKIAFLIIFASIILFCFTFSYIVYKNSKIRRKIVFDIRKKMSEKSKNGPAPIVKGAPGASSPPPSGGGRRRKKVVVTRDGKKLSKKEIRRRNKQSLKQSKKIKTKKGEPKKTPPKFVDSQPLGSGGKSDDEKNSLLEKARSLGIENPEQYSPNRLEQLIMLKDMKGGGPSPQTFGGAPASNFGGNFNQPQQPPSTQSESLIEKMLGKSLDNDSKVEKERIRSDVEKERIRKEYDFEKREKELIEQNSLKERELREQNLLRERELREQNLLKEKELSFKEKELKEQNSLREKELKHQKDLKETELLSEKNKRDYAEKKLNAEREREELRREKEERRNEQNKLFLLNQEKNIEIDKTRIDTKREFESQRAIYELDKIRAIEAERLNNERARLEAEKVKIDLEKQLEVKRELERINAEKERLEKEKQEINLEKIRMSSQNSNNNLNNNSPIYSNPYNALYNSFYRDPLIGNSNNNNNNNSGLDTKKIVDAINNIKFQAKNIQPEAPSVVNNATPRNNFSRPSYFESNVSRYGADSRPSYLNTFGRNFNLNNDISNNLNSNNNSLNNNNFSNNNSQNSNSSNNNLIKTIETKIEDLEFEIERTRKENERILKLQKQKSRSKQDRLIKTIELEIEELDKIIDDFDSIDSFEEDLDISDIY